jgi:hypothetical protein
MLRLGEPLFGKDESDQGKSEINTLLVSDYRVSWSLAIPDCRDYINFPYFASKMGLS